MCEEQGRRDTGCGNAGWTMIEAGCRGGATVVGERDEPRRLWCFNIVTFFNPDRGRRYMCVCMCVWMDGWMDGWIYVFVCMCLCVCVCV